MGKRDRSLHSIKCFCDSVVVAEKSEQLLEVLSFCDREKS